MRIALSHPALGPCFRLQAVKHCNGGWLLGAVSPLLQRGGWGVSWQACVCSSGGQQLACTGACWGTCMGTCPMDRMGSI